MLKKDEYKLNDLIPHVDKIINQVPKETTTAKIGSHNDVGSELIMLDGYGRILKGLGTEYRELAFVSSDPVPPDTKLITETAQVLFTKGTVTSITLLSGSITELTFRDGLVQNYKDANTTDNSPFTVSSLVVGEPLKTPVPFFFGLHATVAGTTPVILLEIAA